MFEGLTQLVGSLVDRLPANPYIRFVALALGAFAAIVGAVKGYKELFPVDPKPTAPIVVKVQVPQPEAQRTLPVRSPEPESRTTPAAPPATPIEERRAAPAVERAAVRNCLPARIAATAPDSAQPSQEQLDQALLVFAGIGNPGPCVAVLLQSGANPNATNTALPQYASGPALHTALNARRWSIAMQLVDAGADPNLRTVYRSPNTFPNGATALRVAMEWGAPTNVIDAIKQRGGQDGM